MYLITGIIGLITSITAYSVYKKYQKTQKKSWCDFTDTISCTNAFKSKEAKLLFLPNSLYGIVYYILFIALAHLNLTALLFILAIPATLASFFLIGVSVKQKNLCPLCLIIYIISFLNQYLLILEHVY